MAALDLLATQAIEEKMQLLQSHWVHKEKQLCFSKEFKDFETAIGFINQVAQRASAQNHHPQIINTYNRVSMTLFTHDAGGLTAKDFELAQAIDQLI